MIVFGNEVQVVFYDPENQPKITWSNGMYSLEEGETPYYKAKVTWEGKEMELPDRYIGEKDLSLVDDLKKLLFGVDCDRLDENLVIDYQDTKVWVNGELLPGEYIGREDPRIMDFLRDYFQLDLSLPELLERFYNN